MPNILFIVNSLRPGGAEKQVVSLLNRLAPPEFRMTLAYLHPGLDLLVEIEPNRLEAIVDCGVRRRLDWPAVQRLADLIVDSDIDTILCTNLYAMLYGVLARLCARRRLRVVEVFHTTILGTWRMRLQMAFYWPLLRACDHLVYVCEGQRRHWRRAGLRAAADCHIYNGIDTDQFDIGKVGVQGLQMREELGFAPGDFVVGICAGLRPEKAHGDLFVSVARLLALGVPVRCLVIGDGPERPGVERKIVELGLESRVIVVGFQADVRPFVAACDVMALVSHAVETFSLATLEAMALGRPVVMSRIGGAEEQVTEGHNGYTYPAGDIDELTTCLGRLVDPVECARMGTNAREVVTCKFGVEKMVHEYQNLLRLPNAWLGRPRS